jgi:hypothetical protein
MKRDGGQTRSKNRLGTGRAPSAQTHRNPPLLTGIRIRPLNLVSPSIPGLFGLFAIIQLTPYKQEVPGSSPGPPMTRTAVTGPKKNRRSRRVVNQKPRANLNVAVGTKVNIQLR